MRNRLPLRCESCGDQPMAGHTCLRCRVALVDADLRPVAAPVVEIYPVPLVRGLRRIGLFLNVAIPGLAFLLMVLPGFTDLIYIDWDDVLYLDKAVAAAAIVCLLFAIPYWGAWLVLRALKGEARADRLRASEVGSRTAGTKTTPLDPCRDGVVRIRGRVRVLSGVDLRGETVAAFRAREPTHAEAQVMDSCAGGRFLVVDETGAALVDDDAIEVWASQGGAPSGDAWSLTARDGDEVEVVGFGRWRPAEADEIAALGPSADVSYRAGPPRVFAFDGNLEAPVVVLVNPAGERVRVKSQPGGPQQALVEPGDAFEERSEDPAVKARVM